MKKSIPLFIFLFSFSLVFAQSVDIRKKNYNLRKGIAMEGYDPVSYFDTKPTEGKKSYS